MSETQATWISVLVIDDHRTMREIVRRLLGQIGVRDVADAEDGAAAREMLHSPQAKEPDPIVCDLHMEKMAGMDVCNTLRHDKNEGLRAIPVIIPTGEQDTFVHDVSRQVGATMVPVKPISAGDLEAQIEAAVGFTI